MVEKAKKKPRAHSMMTLYVWGDDEAHPVWQPTGDAEHENSKCVVVRDNHLEMLTTFIFWMKNSRSSLVLIWKRAESSVGVEKGKSEQLLSVSIREEVNWKKNVFFQACPNKGGGAYPCPNFLALFRSAFLVNKKSLFLQKCIELLIAF